MATAEDTRKAPQSNRGKQLRNTAWIAAGLLLGYSLVRGWGLHGNQLPLCLVCVLLAVWPALRWVRSQPYRFPAFEAFMLTCVTAYALPLVNEHASAMSYGDDIVSLAMLSVVIFQACAVFAFIRTRAVERRSKFWTEPLFSRDIRRWLPVGIWLHVGYLVTGTFTSLIPADLDSILRAVFFGISTACSFLLGRYWGDAQLPAYMKLNVCAALILEVLLQLMSLYLITSIAGLIVFFLAYVSAGRRIPWVTLAAVFVVFSILHNGKTSMREKYWAEGTSSVGVTEMPAFFSEWIGHGLEAQKDEVRTAQENRLLERASLLQMLCRVVDATEHRVPLLMGETYGFILPQLVPRIMWPDKPSGQETTKRLSTYFGLQDENSTRTTSIAFGTLAEAYANFGLMGMACFGLLVGWAAKVISIWTRNCPLLSNGGFIMILVMAWSIQVEFPLSVWIASLYQATICVLLLPYVARIFVY